MAPNNTYHSASNKMSPYYPMYPAGLQYPGFSSTSTPLQVSNCFPTPGLVEVQSQLIYNGGTIITPAFLAEQVSAPRDIHHATYTVCQAGLGGATSPAGSQQTFPIPYNFFGDDYQNLSATGPLEETQPPRIDLTGPPGYGPIEPALIEFDNQDYATGVAETQPNCVRNPSSSSCTDDGIHRCPPDRKPSGIWHCSNEGCLRVFEKKGSLKRHRRTAHLKTKLLDCPVDGCPRVGNKGFTRSDNLRQHRRSKHGEDIPWIKVRLHGSGTVRTAR